MIIDLSAPESYRRRAADDDAQASDYPCHCGSNGCRGTMLVAEAGKVGQEDALLVEDEAEAMVV